MQENRTGDAMTGRTDRMDAADRASERDRTDFEIVAENLKPLERKQISVETRRLAHIRERARLLAGELNRQAAERYEPPGFDFDASRFYLNPEPREALSYLKTHDSESESRLSEKKPAEGQTREFFAQSDAFRDVYNLLMAEAPDMEEDIPLPLCSYVHSQAEASHNFEHLYMCECLLEWLGRSPSPLEFLERETVPAVQSRISYMQNYYSDEAYRIFSENLRNPTVMYGDDFHSVCEDVFYGRAGYCILPVESLPEGRLSSFMRMIARYELKIVMICTVPAGDNGDITRFALLKKNLECLQPVRSHMARNFLEFSVTLPDGPDGILAAARCAGLTLYKIDTISVTYTDSEYAYHMLFDVTGKSINPFLLYLCMTAPRFTPVGLYWQLG